MSAKLAEYGLETDCDLIKRMTRNEWKEHVRKAVLKKNGEKLLANCTSNTEHGTKVHTKTKHIHHKLTSEAYAANPMKMIIKGDKQKARTIFLSQNRMLECGSNFKGTIAELCPQCNVKDDENHRLNICPKWTERNNHSKTWVDFDNIYAETEEEINSVICEIEKVSEVRFANGKMKK